jgi:hypothetical protein
MAFSGPEGFCSFRYSPQGLEPVKILGTFLARLKPCPDTKLLLSRFEFGTIWNARLLKASITEVRVRDNLEYEIAL